MKIVGCDFHPRWQQIAVFDAETGEISEHKLMNGDGEAARFYRCQSKRCSRTARKRAPEFVLDNAFFLIEGYPAMNGLQTSSGWRRG